MTPIITIDSELINIIVIVLLVLSTLKLSPNPIYPYSTLCFRYFNYTHAFTPPDNNKIKGHYSYNKIIKYLIKIRRSRKNLVAMKIIMNIVEATVIPTHITNHARVLLWIMNLLFIRQIMGPMLNHLHTYNLIHPLSARILVETAVVVHQMLTHCLVFRFFSQF